MVKIRKETSDNFTILSNTVIRDERLSWKARGIFIYLWSQAEEWNFYEREVMTHSCDGRDALRSGLKELEEFGYLVRTRERNSDGSLMDPIWTLSELGNNKSPKSGFPTLDKPTLDFPTLDNPTLRNTNLKKQQEKETSTIRNNSSAEAEPRVNDFSKKCQTILDYLNDSAKTNYRMTTKKTQRLIHARLKEGFTVDDFKTVIDKKCAEWLHNPEMSQYLRPETLFGNKFEGYLNQKEIGTRVNGQYKRIEQGTDWEKKSVPANETFSVEPADPNLKDPFEEQKEDVDLGNLRDFFKELEDQTGR